MTTPSWVKELFLAIDRKDAEAFASFFSETGRFRYGSQRIVEGRKGVRDYVEGFFKALSSVHHQLSGYWEVDDGKRCFMQGEVTYTLLDGREVTVPFVNLVQLKGKEIDEYLVYTDPTPLM